MTEANTATIYVEEFGFTLDLKVDLSKYQHSPEEAP